MSLSLRRNSSLTLVCVFVAGLVLVSPALGGGSQSSGSSTAKALAASAPESDSSPGVGAYLLLYGAGWVSALIAVAGFAANSRRKPKLRSSEGTEPEGLEWLQVTAVAGRRPIEAQAIGLSLSWGWPWARHRFQHAGPPRPGLPKHLHDGAVVETGFEISGLIDELCDGVGDSVRKRALSRPYLDASGKIYRGRSTGSPWSRAASLWRSFHIPDGE